MSRWLGARRKIRLGQALPAFVTPARAVAWTEHPFPETVNLIAARRWPGPGAERWVVIVAGKAGVPPTEQSQRIDARLAVVEVLPGTDGPAVRRIARSARPLLPRANWDLLPSELWPSRLCDATCQLDTSPDGFDDNTSLSALDFAPYQLSPVERGLAFARRCPRAMRAGGPRSRL